MLQKTSALLASVAFLSLQTASASTVYSYISEPLIVQSDEIGVFPTSEPIFVTGEFTLDLPLTPNLPVNDWTSLVTDYEFSFRTPSQDGISNVLVPPEDSSEPLPDWLLPASFVFGTDDSGNIDRWGIALDDFRPSYNVSFSTDCFSTVCADAWEERTFRGFLDDDLNLTSLATTSEQPGTWSVVPIPAALPLFCAALVGFGFVARRPRTATQAPSPS